MMRGYTKFVFAVFFVSAVISLMAAQAQTRSTTLQGDVKDQFGAVIVGATVTLTDERNSVRESDSRACSDSAISLAAHTP